MGLTFAADEPITLARGYLDRIRESLVWVHLHRTLFRPTLAEIDKVEHPHRGTWRAHYARLYVDAQLMSIRRIATGTNHDEGSLLKVLQILRKNASTITIDRLHDLAVAAAGVDPGHPTVALERVRMEQDWGDGSGHLAVAVVAADIQTLRRQTNAVVTWATKTIAHIDVKVPAPPTFGELDAAIDAVSDVFRRYGLLLTANDYTFDHTIVLPTWETGLKGLFVGE